MTNTGIFIGVTEQSVQAVGTLIQSIISSTNAEAVKIVALESMTKVLKVDCTSISNCSVNMGYNETPSNS